MGLLDDGYGFYRWEREGAALLRLVTAFNTRAEDVDAFATAARRHADAAPARQGT